ncbi:hypothetical protein NMP65_003531 [Salmonella enterica]|uniref:secretion/conjugation apparatus DotM-related subunit n=1 Tax=Salmonella enterica TaxID=28901 RepID=UPI0003BDC143|nr:hypothetical protein [Salmonella enterica]EHN1352493.1 hypothetical protein [Salmonella enterica subsp. enterica serovar Arechavaleta]APW04068.1 hypothetical protein SEERU717_22925 [Salmonella enterica subsp. enterica serovar Rubislaw str. ATCC 10717]EHR5633841.1 hypothetical protein [Salmonella enterica]EIE3320302.1 hypothetical protein [Salmonella enterica subsp. enterica serovar Arechavaleta]EIO7569992.1 hypothetical protein [Salmonella enterica subsp. enterica serovar Arechavaleta]
MVKPQAKALIRRHSTTRTALSALHAQDLRLPAGQFRWLKGIGRTMWYILHILFYSRRNNKGHLIVPKKFKVIINMKVKAPLSASEVKQTD